MLRTRTATGPLPPALQPRAKLLCDVALCPATCPIIRATPGQDLPVGGAYLRSTELPPSTPSLYPVPPALGGWLAPDSHSLSPSDFVTPAVTLFHFCDVATSPGLLDHSRHCKKDVCYLPVGKKSKKQIPP